jgi:hypothetical protein
MLVKLTRDCGISDFKISVLVCGRRNNIDASHMDSTLDKKAITF